MSLVKRKYRVLCFVKKGGLTPPIFKHYYPQYKSYLFGIPISMWCFFNSRWFYESSKEAWSAISADKAARQIKVTSHVVKETDNED